MFKKKRTLTADTETTGLADKAKIFDFAYVISEKDKILLERSFLVREVLTSPRAMLGAISDKRWRDTFGGKIFRHYIPKIATQELTLHPWREITEILRDDMATYDVDVFAAYNLRFDMAAISKTQQHVCATGKVLTHKPDLLCLWQFSCQTVCQSPLFHQVARERGESEGWITPAGNVRTNAEKVYAFLTGELDFIEAHTALEDAQIETEILMRLKKRKAKIPYNVIDHMPWKLAQRFMGKKLL